MCVYQPHPAACEFGCSRMTQLHTKTATENAVERNNSPSIVGFRYICSKYDRTSAVIWRRFRVDLTNLPVIDGTHEFPPLIYFYEARYVSDEDSDTGTNWSLISMQSNHMLTMKLRLLSRVQLRVFALDMDGLLSDEPSLTDWITSFSDSDVPHPPTWISVVHQRNNDETLSAVAVWKPNPTYRSCFYHLSWQHQYVSQYDKFEVEDEFRHIISPLQYGTNYTVSIRAMASLDIFYQESSPTNTSFLTMTCLQFRNWNYTACAPETSVNSPTVTITSETEAFVSWKTPDNTTFGDLSNYSLQWRSISQSNRCNGNESRSIDVSPDTNQVRLSDLVRNCFYIIGIAAVSAGGTGPMVWIQFDVSEAVISEINGLAMSLGTLATMSQYDSLFWLLGVAIFVVICFATMIFLVFNRTQRRKRRLERSKHSWAVRTLAIRAFPQSPHYRARLLPGLESNELKSEIVLKEQLGEGLFGLVFRGECKLSGLPNVVAVKVLKESSATNCQFQMMQEIELMKRFKYPHPNIVRFFGVWSAMDGFVMEYCADGNLKQYLSSKCFKSKMLDDNNAIIDRTILVSYGRQISTGMLHLHNQQLIHRDLAARNILVTDGGATVKISDFGLCRQVACGEYRCPNPDTVLPLKWMSPESINTGCFTFKSDVWSFGVLLWELASLGEDPYAQIQCSELLPLLIGGYRMARPNFCSEEMYNLMCKCWLDSPNDRPSFSSIRLTISAMATGSADYLIL